MLLVALLFGCVLDSSSTCVAADPVEVEDDEILGTMDVSAADVMADIGGARTATGKLADGTQTDATVTVARGGRPALFTAVELVQTSEVKPGLGHDAGPLQIADCGDRLMVPTVVTFASDDGSIRLGGDGEAEIVRVADAPATRSTTVSREIDPESETIPSVAGGDAPFLTLWYDDDQLDYAKVGWGDAPGGAVYEFKNPD